MPSAKEGGHRLAVVAVAAPMEEFADLIAQQLQCRVIRKLLKLFLRIAKSHHVPLKSTNFNPDLLILWEGEKKGTGGRLSKREERRADSYLSDYTGNYRGGRSGGIAFFGETL